MRVVDAAGLDAVLDFPSLIEALRQAFAGEVTVPLRHHHAMPQADGTTATCLLMPAWDGSALGVKVVNVYPGNGARALPAVHGTYLLMSGRTGETLAAMDGARLTQWRTAAASALAAAYLAPLQAQTLLMVGAGALAPFLIRAHASVRPIRRVLIWNHTPEKAMTLAGQLAHEAFSAEIAPDLEAAVREADIISTATLSSTPMIMGAWLKPGTHLDLVGAYTPATRESDDEAVRRALVFVDTRGGAMKEGGDIVLPLASGVLRPEDIRADLFDLARGTVTFARQPDDITLFKSVGTALEDLAAATLAWQKLGASPERVLF
jgi:ornithine cyclodeaminase/alanine dehydrogenase-like protein (mu-crystallin family)